MFITTRSHGLNKLQRTAAALMGVMVLVTFLAANVQAVLWQSSQWLVSTVLPAVVVNLTNDERQENNAAPLRRNTTLDAAAQLKAEHMAKNQYFAHYAPDGTTPWHWFDEAGYTYAHAGENLAIHFTDSSEVVEAWMDSPTHRKNIVDGKFTEIGVGTAKGKFDGYNTVYVVQLFGTPAATPAPTQPVVVRESVVATAQAAAPVAIIPDVELENTDVLAAADTNTVKVEPAELPSESVEIVLEQSDTAEKNLVATDVEPNSPEEVELTESTTEVQAEVEITEAEEVPPEDVVVVESSLTATSSGLAVASINGDGGIPETISAAGIATRPHLVLEIVYALLALTVSGLLIASVIMEARRLHPVQVAYGGGMMATMALLLWLHTVLVSGAVIA